ncbi:MAG: glucose-6-phosphate isomerase [Nitrospirae bacterium]|nr:glucose-6-phosphate isomerase [Nitrospirota bacterium]MCL5422408.1 glucose-6-phosphate isomerase [Nitrospirota bacterium]
MIELNFSNMMTEVLGEKGISERQIEALRDRVDKAHHEIVQKRWAELAFMDLVRQDTGEIRKTAEWVRKNAEDFLIFGIGGSALGPRSILEALSPFHNLKRRPRVFIYDNVDPRTLSAILSLVDVKKSIANVITKSGSTAETMASFMVIWDELSRAMGNDAGGRVIATTDPEKGNLRTIARDKGFRTLSIPPGVVGRYSVLSPVGLLLAEVIGIDAKEMLRGAADINDRCSEPEIWKNPAYLFGTLLYLMDKEEKRNISVMIPYADGLKYLSEWFSQLWAESLGKLGMGMTPYPSLGTVDQHSQLQLWMEGPEDKVFIFMRVLDFGADIRIPEVFKDMEGIGYLGGHLLSELIKAEEESTELALTKNKRPNMTIHVPSLDAYHIGQLFQFFEIATAFTGFLYGVNPFNQPGVEEGKNFTYGMMGKKGFDQRREEVEKAREKKVCYRL